MDTAMFIQHLFAEIAKVKAYREKRYPAVSVMLMCNLAGPRMANDEDFL